MQQTMQGMLQPMQWMLHAMQGNCKAASIGGHLRREVHATINARLIPPTNES